jgi:SAM-dependent methyltransferase/uncharacterized protein YbaR (Trm112 family)
MRSWAAGLLRCIACGSTLESTAFEVGPAGETFTGVLRCQSAGCSAWYPIVRGIPRMLPPDLRVGLTREFVAKFQSELTARGVTTGAAQRAPDDPLHGLKQDTIRNFGFEWIEYSRFGWDDPVWNLAHEEALFRRKALLEPEELKGTLVLDAGCGNGRYSYWASRYGARVVGVDLGDGVESAAANTRDLADVQIVQGDIFRLPFAERTFDAVFSIGVLMHTGNAKRATARLATLVRPGGSLTAHVYGKGNPISEAVDWTLRQWTTRLSIQRLQSVTRGLFRTRQALERAGLADFANRFVRIGSHPHIIFDWYAAPIATHHTYPEVLGWFGEMGLSVVRTNAEANLPLKQRIVRPVVGPPGVVTVKGQVAG